MVAVNLNSDFVIGKHLSCMSHIQSLIFVFAVELPWVNLLTNNKVSNSHIGGFCLLGAKGMKSSTRSSCKRKQILIGSNVNVQVMHMCVVYMFKRLNHERNEKNK